MFDFSSKKSSNEYLYGRRAFLGGCGAAIAGFTCWKFAAARSAFAAMPSKGDPKQVTIVEFTDAGERKEKTTLPVVRKTDDEWKKQLSPLSFAVTRQAGTERPYTGENLKVHDKGVFRCICCDTALFSSTTKFESGTGWPSFWAPIAKENVTESADNSLGMLRTAVSCRRCEAHLGHVFDDGPRPTGLRYCMNSVALRFAKAT
jgi:peptide-methionine (R)-S-oxide reductase